MPTDTLNNTLNAYTFGFVIDGAPIAFFTAVSGLSWEFDVVEHQMITNDGKSVLKKIPGRLKYSEIVLKRGMTEDDTLHKWMKQIVDRGGVPEYKTASIVLYDHTYEPVATFNFDKCWPSKLSGSDLSSGSDEVMIEEMTIQHQMMEWV